MAATLVLLPALIDMVPKAMNPCDMGRAYELPVTSTSPALRSCDMDKCNTMSAVSTPLNLLLLDEFIDDSYTIFDPGAFCGSSADHSIAQNMSGGPCATRDPSLACSSVLEDALFKPWHAASDTLRGRAQKWAGWFASHAIQTTHTFLHFGDVQYARLRRARTPNIHLIREDVTLNASMTPSDTSATVSPSILGPGAARVAKVGRARSVVEPSRNTLCDSLAHTDCNHNHSILHDYISATTKPVTWHTDNGGEFMSNDINEFCEEFAIKRSFSVPYAPPQNAHAERMWGIILRPMRIMLAESGVHESFWTYAAHQACLLHNVLPSTKLAGEMSPYQAKYKVPPDVGNIRVWGCTCWYHLPDHERESKLSPRAVPAVHLGGDPHRRGYLVYVPYLNRITTAYHLNFQERKFLKFTDEGIINKPRDIKPLRDVEPLYRESRDKESNKDKDNEREAPEMCDHPECDLPKHPESVPHSYEQRETRNYGPNPPRRRGPDYVPPQYAEMTVVDHCFTVSIAMEDVNNQVMQVLPEDIMADCPTPNTYQQAIDSRQAERWKESMSKEITDLMKNETWELVRRSKIPKSHKVAKSKWVYKIKLNKDGSIERFKSRFVVCGYSQIKGIDYTHSFSATLRATSFRLLMALAAGERLKLEHFDVTNAFTQSDIDSEIYVEPPRGFEKYDKDGRSYVLKLKRALYGTKQASRMWQLKLRSHLMEHMGFSNSSHDPCLFSRRWDDGTVILVGVYVDDIVVAHNGKLQWFIDEFTGPKGFRGKHVGPLSWFLGMSVEQGSDFSVEVHQEQYIAKLIEKFAPAHVASLVKHSMPCNPLTFQKLSTAKTDKERDKMRDLNYLQLIGSLLYLTNTRPDICYHMSVLCSFMHDPSPDAYYAAIDLLLYVNATKHYRLNFNGSAKPPSGVDPKLASSISTSGGLIAYSDSSWRKPDSLGFSMFGYVIYLYGSPISYAAKSLKIVALSSAEAEYAAASYTCKEVQFVRKVMSDLGFPPKGPVVLAVDNQAAIKIAENVGVTARTKHFVDAIHYFRHLVDHRVVVPTFVRTNFQRADGFTKPLGKGVFRDWTRKLLVTGE